MKLLINNSYCTIQNMTSQTFSDLKKIMYYQSDEGGYRRSFYNKEYLISKKGVFPTGLLYLFRQYINKSKVSCTEIDLRKIPKEHSKTKINLTFKPYPEQEEAARIAKEKHQGIISMPTGTGKSAVIALIIDKLKVNTLIVVPSLELKKQLSRSLAEAFGEKHVGEGKLIWVQNIDGLKIAPLKGYDCVIIDEYHHSAAKTYRKLNRFSWENVYYRFGLTATPFRSRTNERILLESILSSVIFTLSYDTASKKGYITPVECYYVVVPPKKVVKGFSWHEVYRELVVDNEVRNRLIAQLMTKLKDEFLICLIKEIEHGYKLSLLTNINFVNGQDTESKINIDTFNSGKIKHLIGTTGVIGEGVDTKPAEWIVIAGLGKSKNQFMQNVGRGVRRYGTKESAKIIIFKDTSHKWTKSHFAEQVKILKEEYGCIPVEIVLG